MSLPTLLVTGASGQLGHQVATFLLARGGHRLVLATRSPAKLADLAARGAIVRAADFDDPASLAQAFAGVDRLLLISTDALFAPGQRIAQHRAAIHAAVQAGVRHIVYTSLTNAVPDSVQTLAVDHHATEEALAAAPLSWTILRNNLYTENLLLSLPHAIATGDLVTASGPTGAIAYVTRADAARAAAAALVSHDTTRRTLDISGPAALTGAEVARLAAELSGRAVRHVPVPAEALRAGLTAAGLPPALVEGLVTFDLAAARGELAHASSAVRDLTGEAPTGVAEFLATQLARLTPAATATSA